MKKPTMWLCVGFIFLLSACAVTKEEIQAAISVCKDHGGIKYLYAKTPAVVICVDGIKVVNLVSR